MASDRANTTVGFIGLGSQGGPMAQRIIDAGYPVVLWARRPEALEAFTGANVTTAATVADLGARCDHVGVCVVNDQDVLDVCDALIPAMRPGSRIAIHATINPDTCAALAAKAAERGLALIDAPVSGGGHGAAAGTLTVMLGGEEGPIAMAWPVFETFGGLIVHLGPVGAGQAAKLVNNTLLAANMALSHYALAAGAAMGIDRKALAQLVKASSGRSYGFEIYASLPQPQAFNMGGKLLAKDVGLLCAVLGDDPSLAPLRDTARPFLEDIVLAKTPGE